MKFLRFFAVGTAGTAAYAGLYLVLVSTLPRAAALACAWLVATVLTNLAHRLVTFRITTQRGQFSDAILFLVTALIGLVVTNALIAAGSGTNRPFAVAMIVVGTAIGGALRFFLMYAWVRRRHHRES